MHDVLITVVSSQVDAEGDENRIELATEGKYYEKNGCRYITYKESEISGLEGTTTLIKAEIGQIAVIRMGTVEVKQVFIVGQRHISSYITPYGAFEMGVNPWVVKFQLNEEGGHLDLEYDLEIDGRPHSRNTLHIKIRRG